MVKVDPSRDYYTDLELPASADTNDIKKQFKKLALKWHPDRNPGKEADVNSKFQLIQSAHEVLSDPELRRKYDSSRVRAPGSRYPGASGVRGNPWANAASHFPPPPRREANTQQKPPMPKRNPTTSGASRYSNFASAFQGRGGTRPSSAQEDPLRTNQSTSQAWDSMRSKSRGRQQQPQPGAPPPPPPREPPRSSDSESMPRTASQRQKAQASFGARKSGYVPQSPGGDEPPVRNSHYFTTRTHSNIFNNASTSASAGNSPTKNRPTHVPIPNPLAQFRDSMSGDGRHRSPYATPGGEKTNIFDEAANLARAKSTRESSRRYGNLGADPGVSRPRQRSSSVPRASSNDASSEDSTRASAGGSRRSGHSSRLSDQYKPKPETKTSAEKGDTAAAGTTQSNGGPSVFSFNVDDDTFKETTPNAKRFARSSTDNINTRFVSNETPDGWEFSAGGPSEDGSHPTPKSRAQSGGRVGRAPTRPDATTSGIASETEAKGEAIPASFEAGNWNENVGPHHFAYQPSQSASASPTRRPGSRKPKPIRKTAGTAGLVDDDLSEEKEWQHISRPPSGIDSPNAMDIDSPPLEPSDRLKVPKSYSARKIPVEPNRPEWRAGNANGINASAGQPTPSASPEQAQPAAAPQVASPVLGGSEDTEEFRANLDELRNVEPFAKPTASGLGSFGDLKDNLPFESQASAQIPIQPEKSNYKPLAFPTIPVAPRLPPTYAVPGIKPNLTQWREYSSKFYEYIQKWEAFNSKVLDHFDARKRANERRTREKGSNWLEKSAQEYIDELQQDKDVQQKWNVACEEHAKQVRNYQLFRDRVK